MFCKATVLVLGTLATNRIVLYAAMQFVKGTLWKNTMNGQFCMMKNQTSLLNNSEDISSANYLNNRKKDLQKENASRISLWAFAGFWTLFQFHLCFSSIRKRWQISTRKQECPFIHWLTVSFSANSMKSKRGPRISLAWECRQVTESVSWQMFWCSTWSKYLFCNPTTVLLRQHLPCGFKEWF